MSFVILKRRLLHVVSLTEEVQERDNDVDWTADDANDLVAMEHWSKWLDPWGMRFHNPDGVIDDILAFEPTKLELDIEHQCVISSCLYTGKKLEILPEKCIA